MELPPVVDALILGIVEGLTEFLPVSSTGHLIVVSDLLGQNDEKGKIFDIVIQLGAILAVCWEFRTRIVRAFRGFRTDPVQHRFAINLFVAFLPAAIVGLLFQNYIKKYLFNPTSVAIALIVGALVIFAVERWYRGIIATRVNTVYEMTTFDALVVGIAQCFSLIPGTSRSAATIMGGMLRGLSREAATEFSFFLAIPIMAGAFVVDAVKNRHELMSVKAEIPLIAVGFVVSFVVALAVIRAMLAILTKRGLAPFGWFRIAVGAVGLALLYFA